MTERQECVALVPRADMEYFWDFPPQPCAKCGKETRWVDLCFEAHLCAGACSDAMWADYVKASRDD